MNETKSKNSLLIPVYQYFNYILRPIVKLLGFIIFCETNFFGVVICFINKFKAIERAFTTNERN